MPGSGRAIFRSDPATRLRPVTDALDAPSEPRQPSGSEGLRRRLTSGPAAVLLVTTVTLLVAVAGKLNCVFNYVPRRGPASCYNDIQHLWHVRQMAEHLFPYQGTVQRVYENGELVRIDLGAGQIEYPVLTGVFAWLTSLPADGNASYLVANMIALAPFALLTSWLLYDLVGRRAYWFAAAPALAAYAYLNWDLLPVTAAVAAVWTWRRGRVGWTGVLLGVGICAKIWPGFLLAPLVVLLLLQRRLRDAARLAGAAVGTTVALNLPFLLLNAEGWAAPYLMQSLRRNERNTNSIWFWLFPDAPLHSVATASNIAVALGWTVLLVAGYLIARRASRLTDGGAVEYPWLQVGAAMVTAYVVLGRVDSPQYGLWLIPFVALLGVPAWVAVAFVASDMFLWMQWSWLWGSPDWMMGLAVALRVLTLTCLAVAFLVSRTRWVERDPSPQVPAEPGPDAGPRAETPAPPRSPAGPPAPAPTPEPHP